MTIREAVYGTMIPSQKRFMEEEALGYIWHEITGIDFDDELDKEYEYEFDVRDEEADTYLTITMSWDGEKLNIDNTWKSVRVEYSASFDEPEDGDDYYFEEI